MNRKCFTLTELVGIAACSCLLLGVLIPVLANSQAQGKKSSCLDNLRLQGKGIAQYVSDNNGVQPVNYPSLNQTGFKNSYAFKIADYVEPEFKKSYTSRKPITHTNSIFLCPDDDRAISWWYPMSYSAVRQNIYPFTVKEAVNLTPYGKIKNPAKLFAIMDGKHSAANYPAGINGIQPPIYWNVAQNKHLPRLPFKYDLNKNGIKESGLGKAVTDPWYFNGAELRHNSNVNILFVDGHTETIGEKEFVVLDHWKVEL